METNPYIRDITGQCHESVKCSVNNRYSFGYNAGCSRSDLGQPILHNAKHDLAASHSQWPECAVDSDYILEREGFHMRGEDDRPNYELFQEVQSISVAKHKRKGE